MYIHIYIYIIYDICKNIIYIYNVYLVFTTEVFLGVAAESWPDWNLNPGPLDSTQMLSPIELSGHEFDLHSQPTLDFYSNFIFLFSAEVLFSFQTLHKYKKEALLKNFLQVQKFPNLWEQTFKKSL